MQDILLFFVKGAGKQMPQIMGIYFFLWHSSFPAQLLHRSPHIAPVHGPSTAGNKNRAVRDPYPCRIVQKDIAKLFAGIRITRLLPLFFAIVFPLTAASTVIYCSSLIRIPVAHSVKIRKYRRICFFRRLSPKGAYIPPAPVPFSGHKKSGTVA